MKLPAIFIALALFLSLSGCAPQAAEEKADQSLCARTTDSEPVASRLCYRLTVDGDLLITTVPEHMAEGVEYPPLVSGYADITGYGLELKQGPYCVNACQPNQYGYIGLRFEPQPRGNRIVVDVLAGEPVAGEARMDTGLGVSLVASFEPGE